MQYTFHSMLGKTQMLLGSISNSCKSKKKNQFMGAAIVCCCKAVLTFLAYEKIVHATYVAISNQATSAAQHFVCQLRNIRFT